MADKLVLAYEGLPSIYGTTNWRVLPLLTRSTSGHRETRVIELFGLPGAGKTTVINALDLPPGTLRRDDLIDARQRMSPLQLAWLILRTLTQGRWLWALGVLAWRTPIRHGEGLSRLLRLAVMRNWIASQQRLLVLDQGPLQAVWSIFFTEGVARPPRAALIRVLRLLYADMGIVLVEIEVPPETAAARIRSRQSGNSRLDGLPVEKAHGKLRRVDTLPAELLGAAREAGVEVRSLSGEADIAHLAASLEDLVADV